MLTHLKYVAGTSDYGIVYSNDIFLHGFADADWGESVDDRRSISGYGFIFRVGLVSWLSKKQLAVSGSTTKAEYKAYYFATFEALWLLLLLQELKVEVEVPLVVYSDSQSAMALARNPVYHSKVKHIAVSYHFTREQVNEGVIKLVYCASKGNLVESYYQSF